MNISMPLTLAQYIEHEVESGEYASTSDFIRTLVRQHQAQSAESWIDATIRQRKASASASDADLVPQSELEREFLAERP